MPDTATIWVVHHIHADDLRFYRTKEAALAAARKRWPIAQEDRDDEDYIVFYQDDRTYGVVYRREFEPGP